MPGLPTWSGEARGGLGKEGRSWRIDKWADREAASIASLSPIVSVWPLTHSFALVSFPRVVPQAAMDCAWPVKRAGSPSASSPKGDGERVGSCSWHTTHTPGVNQHSGLGSAGQGSSSSNQAPPTLTPDLCSESCPAKLVPHPPPP